MNAAPYRITAKITVVETNEVHHKHFDNVQLLLDELSFNVSLAEIALGREFKPKTEFDGDFMTLTIRYADTNEPYMIVIAQRHIPPQGSDSAH